MHALAAALLLAGSLAAQDDRCDPGSVELSRDEAARVLVCRLISGLTLEQIAALSPDAVARLSPADQKALELRRVLLSAADELPFMPERELAEFERSLDGDAYPPAASAALLALEAALLAVGGFMLLGSGKLFETAFPGGRKGLALGALLGLGLVCGGQLAAGVPFTVSRTAVMRLGPLPAPLSPELARRVLADDRLQHASRHLIKAGLLPAWNTTTTKGAFVSGMQSILTAPRLVLDVVTKQGKEPARVFVGRFGGQDVAVFVYKQGGNIGKVMKAVVPKGYQRKLYGIE